MTFDEWLDAPISGTTRRAYYSDNQLTAARDAWEAATAAEHEALRTALVDAADDIEGWAAYASPYFQDKHDLAGCVAKYRAIAAIRSRGTK